MNDLVRCAEQYAVAAHAGVGQRRKYTGLPYDVHLRAVAERVASCGGDPAMVAAAWLHDAVEDTPVTAEDIRREFGEDVAALVCDLTDVSKPEDGNRAARKALDRAHLAEASPRAKSIKLADILDNCGDICRHDPGFGRVYLAEAKSLLEVLREGDGDLYRLAAAAVGEWSEKLGLSAGLQEGIPGGRHGLRLFVDTFAARDILEPLPSFDAESLPALFLDGAERPTAPIIGVRTKGRVSGYLLADDVGASGQPPVRPVEPGQLLSLDAPLVEVVRALTAFPCGFVAVNGMVVGAITRAEVEKPVVRMWLFGIIMLIELLAVRQIRLSWPGESWSGLVSEGRLEKARALQSERARRGLKAELLDCLQFADKFQLLLRDPGFIRQVGFPSVAAAKKALKELESLRNDLAHGQDIAEHDWPPIVRLAERIQSLLAF